MNNKKNKRYASLFYSVAWKTANTSLVLLNGTLNVQNVCTPTALILISLGVILPRYISQKYKRKRMFYISSERFASGFRYKTWLPTNLGICFILYPLPSKCNAK